WSDGRIALMNTAALGARTKQISSKILAVAAKLPHQVFGNFSWRPPLWLSRMGDKWRHLESHYPRAIAPAVIGVFVIAWAAAWSWNWYQHLPKPRRVSVKVEPIAVTRLEKELKFSTLV